MSGKKGTTWKILKQEEFDKAKALVGYGLSIKQIATLIKKSSATVSRIREAKDFADYKARIIVAKEKYQPTTKAEIKAPEVVSVDTEVLQVLTNINEVLAQLNERLSFIEEHIEVVPKRKLFR